MGSTPRKTNISHEYVIFQIQRKNCQRIPRCSILYPHVDSFLKNESEQVVAVSSYKGKQVKNPGFHAFPPTPRSFPSGRYCRARCWRFPACPLFLGSSGCRPGSSSTYSLSTYSHSLSLPISLSLSLSIYLCINASIEYKSIYLSIGSCPFSFFKNRRVASPATNK